MMKILQCYTKLHGAMDGGPFLKIIICEWEGGPRRFTVFISYVLSVSYFAYVLYCPILNV